MILSCPACSTRYSVPDTAVGAKGRTVRCASCEHSWHVAGIAQPQTDSQTQARSPAMEAAPAPAERRRTTPAAYRAKVEERQRRRARTIAAGAWGGIAACLTAALVTGWMFRADIVRALPQTASAYALTGADVNMYGLVIENLVSERVMDNGEPALSVRADLRNIDRTTRQTPLVRFDLRDAQGEAFFAWTVAPETAALAPGESIPVAAILVNPPERASDVLMTLTTEPVGPDAERAAHEANLADVLRQEAEDAAAHTGTHPGAAPDPEAAHEAPAEAEHTPIAAQPEAHHEDASAGAHDAHG